MKSRIIKAKYLGHDCDFGGYTIADEKGVLYKVKDEDIEALIVGRKFICEKAKKHYHCKPMRM